MHQTAPIHALPQRSFASDVDEGLRALLDGLAVGDRLPSETALQARFGVSRAVVREGLARLRAEGRIMARKGSGSYVARPPGVATLPAPPIHNLEDLLNRHDLRVAIECETAYLAADRWSSESLAAISATRAALSAQLRQGIQTGQEEFAFHSAIAAATRNPVLLHSFQALLSQISDWIAFSLNLRLLTPDQRIAIVDEEHAAIHDAIAQRRPEEASRAMRRHLLHGRERILRGVAE